jgi:hypothetical protein
MTAPFSGSYEASDVTFLLTQLPQVQTLGVREKEAHIQKGGHYSEVLSPELAPSAAYLQLFKEQTVLRAERLAADLCELARQMHCHTPQGPIGLVSLARAGTPMGVLLKRALEWCYQRTTSHYSVSIMRDRGLDLNALAYVRQRHADNSIVFVDGWTGKGVIGAELRKSVQAFNLREGAQIDPSLYVVADIAGTAAVSATREDYLIPSAILNATVSGLVSRTVLSPALGPGEFHGCLYLEHLMPQDQSRYFVAELWAAMQSRFLARMSGRYALSEPTRSVCAASLAASVESYRSEFDLPSCNFVKPGVGEATRVMLRRAPLLLVLQNPDDENVKHLVHLAKAKNVPVSVRPSLPCRAMALIEQLD